MLAENIAGKKFDMVLRGYKPDDVEDFLKEVAAGFSTLQKEKEDLEKKLAKTRNCREDGDANNDGMTAEEFETIKRGIAENIIKFEKGEITAESFVKSMYLLVSDETYEETKRLIEKWENK